MSRSHVFQLEYLEEMNKKTLYRVFTYLKYSRRFYTLMWSYKKYLRVKKHNIFLLLFKLLTIKSYLNDDYFYTKVIESKITVELIIYILYYQNLGFFCSFYYSWLDRIIFSSVSQTVFSKLKHWFEFQITGEGIQNAIDNT